MQIIIILLVLLLLGSMYIIWTMTIKEESLEEYYETKLAALEERLVAVKLQVEDTVEKLKVVDIRGSFEADDEVGFAFKEIKQLNEDLLQFIITYNKQINNAEKTESN